MRFVRHLATTLVIGGLVAAAAIATTGRLLIQQSDAALTRVPVPELDEPMADPSSARTTARHFLVVGSDSREGIDDTKRRELRLGSFGGQRSDTVIYVSVSEDRQDVTLVSLPRDLLVIDRGEQTKLTDTFLDGPDNLVRVIRENFGLPVNHYVEVSIQGFLSAVRTLGSVEICLDDPLRDPRSGADFDEGCHRMSAEEALSYVRSRQGERGDYERIDRQQRFIRGVLDELTRARVLADPRRLFRLADQVASNVATDENFDTGSMVGLADELRGVIAGGIPMTAVPAYPRDIDGRYFLIPYGPAARPMFEDLRQGRPLPDLGSDEDREDAEVAVYSGGRSGAPEIRAVLAFAGFPAGVAGAGPAGLDAGPRTTVFAVAGFEDEAEWVAAALRAPLRPLPTGLDPPGDAVVVVATGDDALS
jgi:LCP family protein required for cell wall assembly